MRPVVVNPAITLAQLFDEFVRINYDPHRALIRDQLLVRLRQRLTGLLDAAREAYARAAGEPPEATLDRLRQEPPAAFAAWLEARPGLGAILDGTDPARPHRLPISHHPDRLIEVTRGYGTAERPEDFLEGFTAFVRDHVNTIAGLTIVAQRPRDLTRASLRALRQELDARGYSETALRRAWADAMNEDIAASIVGFVRQAALGDPLMPYAERVQGAMRRILASRNWTDPQRRWLRRIGEQIEREIIVDRAALDEEPFRADGGFARLNRIFGGAMEAVLSAIQEEIWGRSA